jgi:bifunctional DNA-binding transcriptional regulator/antitoxin component of YhaV-PrlF toxin-antitoxin module
LRADLPFLLAGQIYLLLAYRLGYKSFFKLTTRHEVLDSYWALCSHARKITPIESGDIRMDATVRIRQNGMLTLPDRLRQRYGIKEGDTFQVVDLEGVFVLTRARPLVPELARDIEKARQDAGLAMDDLLEELREQRKHYVAEKFDIRDDCPQSLP